MPVELEGCLILKVMIMFLIIFFLIFALICAKNIRHGIYAIIFAMPLYVIRFSVFGVPSTVLEMMIYILFLVWILNGVHSLSLCHSEPVMVRNLRMLLCKKNVHIKTVFRYLSLRQLANHFKMTKREDFLNILNIGIVLLFLGLAISIFSSTDLRTSLGIFKGWFFDPFLFFIVFVNVIKKDKQIILSLKSWIFSGVIVSLIGIFYLLNSEITFDGRLRAFFLSPNYLAMYLSPIFLITLFFLLNKKVFNIPVCRIGRQYPIFSIFLIIISIPLFFTYSYGAFLGIFVGMLYIFRNQVSGTRNLISAYASLLIIVFAGFIFISSNKFDQIIDSENRSSSHSRLMIWNTSKEIIKDNPIFGIGPGTFQEAYLSYAERFDKPYLEWAVPQPHNIFLAFYLQTGLIGFIGFILILTWFFRCNYYNCRNETSFYLYGVANVLMIYILIHGFSDTTYWKNDLSLMFWLIIGMAVVRNNKTE